MFSTSRPRPGVTVLTIDDGKVNAMGPAFVATFGKAWEEATASGDAVVITGNAKAFCAGLDLKRLPGLDRAGLLAFTRDFIAVFRQVLGGDRPVVAHVDGPALAGGAVLALCADFRVVGPRAKLGLTEVMVGVPFPAPVATLAAARLPAPEHAPTLLDAAIRDGPETCVAHGWAHQVGDLDAAVALAARLAEHPRTAFASARHASNDALTAAFAAFDETAIAAWVDVVGSERVMTEIMAAFARITAR